MKRPKLAGAAGGITAVTATMAGRLRTRVGPVWQVITPAGRTG